MGSRGRSSPRSRTSPSSRSRPPAAGGSAFPRAIRTSAAPCRRASRPSPTRSRATTSSSSSAPRSSPTTPTCPASYLPEGAELVQITSDPDEAARAPMGHAIVGDVKQGARPPACGRVRTPTATPATRCPIRSRARSRARSPARRPCTRLRHAFPEDGIIVLEAPSATLALRNQLRALAPRLVLLRRGRRPRLRPRRRGRRPDRPARPAGRLRDRRGLGAVRDHRALDAPPPTTCR